MRRNLQRGQSGQVEGVKEPQTSISLNVILWVKSDGFPAPVASNQAHS